MADGVGELLCPKTKSPLQHASHRQVIESGLGPHAERHTNGSRAPSDFLISDDSRVAYPVIHGIPILLWPEAYAARDLREAALEDEAQYAEAYDEMSFYNAVAAQRQAEVEGIFHAEIARVLSAHEAVRDTFPNPPSVWHSETVDRAEWTAYAHLTPLRGRRVLQFGGLGIPAVKFALAGADSVWVLCPMLDEVVFTTLLARRCGVGDRIRGVVGVAEELPFHDQFFDRVFTPSSLHHTVTRLSLRESARVLREGGRFAAVEPWRAPGYVLGTRLFGRQEKGVNCVVLDADRLRDLPAAFGAWEVVHHGALTRYVRLAIRNLGKETSPRLGWIISGLDDMGASVLGRRVRGQGSAVAVLSIKDSTQTPSTGTSTSLHKSPPFSWEAAGPPQLGPREVAGRVPKRTVVSRAHRRRRQRSE